MMIFIWSWGVATVFMTLVWLIYLKTKNPGIVDVAWGIGIALQGIFYVAYQIHQGFSITSLQLITLTLLLIWSMRLSGYLWLTRILKGKRDERYLNLAANWKHPRWHYFLNYQFQGFLQIVLSLAFVFIFLDQARATWISGLAFVLFTVGLTGETIADFQLHTFKKNPENKGQVCAAGLWQYSRHPNYFFEVLIWLSFAIASSQSKYGLIAFVSPLVLYLIMTKITGPLTEEQSLQSRGQLFKDYMKKTPMFFPKIRLR